MNEHKSKYIKLTESYYKEIKNNKYYKKHKICFKMTHIKGYHIDFYEMPYEFNKKSPRTNYNKFYKRIVGHMNNLLTNAKNDIYLSEQVVETMIYQINNIILTTSELYWKNFGFSEKIIENIKNTYKMLELFLNIYKNTVPTSDIIGIGKTKEGNNLYDFCIQYNLGVKITPNQLQKYAMLNLNKLVEQIENVTKKSFDIVKQNLSSSGSYFTNKSDMITSASRYINDLFYKIKPIFSDNIIIPLPSSIKIREIPTLTAKWSAKGKSHDNFFYLNTEKINSIKQETIKKLCIHETIMGHILERINYKNELKKYNINKNIIDLYKKGIPALKEGWAIYCEEIAKDMFDDISDISILMSHVYHSVKIIIDTGLNSANVDVKFNLNTATEFLNKYTMLDDESINNEILKSLSNPAHGCSYGFGYKIIKILESKFLAKNNNKKDFYDFILTNPFSIPSLFTYMENYV